MILVSPPGVVKKNQLGPNDPDSKVSQVQNKNKRAYRVLAELNHRQRTQHLAKIRNPHPSSESK